MPSFPTVHSFRTLLAALFPALAVVLSAVAAPHPPLARQMHAGVAPHVTAPEAQPAVLGKPAGETEPLIAVARAFNAAWNMHDLTATTSFLAADAEVRQRDVRMVRVGVTTAVEDAYGRRAPLPSGWTESGAPGMATPRGTGSTSLITWATGREVVAGWIETLFADDHEVDALDYGVASDTVAWTYRARVAPYKQVPGVLPAEGSATATIVDGAITQLLLESRSETVIRRDAAMAVAFQQARGRSAALWEAYHDVALGQAAPAAPVTR